MSGRIFQNSVLQFKETTDRTIGVIDAEGTVIACSELTAIGKRWSKYVEPIVSADGTCVALEGKCFKALPSWGNTFDYAVFATGDDSMSRTVCSMAAVALNAAKNYYEEKHDKGSFIKNIISDNILISDIYMRAKELHVDAEVARGVFVVRPVDDRLDTVPVDVVQGLFPDRQNDFVLSVGEHDVALIHQMGEDATAKDMEEVALRIEEALRADGESRVFVGIGTLALHLRDLAKSYKEAQIAIEVGKVFDTERYVINYENLGIGRLIYQLPTTLDAHRGHVPADLYHIAHRPYGRDGDPLRTAQKAQSARARDEYDDVHGAALYPHAHRGDGQDHVRAESARRGF